MGPLAVRFVLNTGQLARLSWTPGQLARCQKSVGAFIRTRCDEKFRVTMHVVEGRF